MNAKITCAFSDEKEKKKRKKKLAFYVLVFVVVFYCQFLDSLCILLHPSNISGLRIACEHEAEEEFCVSFGVQCAMTHLFIAIHLHSVIGKYLSWHNKVSSLSAKETLWGKAVNDNNGCALVSWMARKLPKQTAAATGAEWWGWQRCLVLTQMNGADQGVVPMVWCNNW